MFDVFDTPVVSVSCPERSVTTVAPQALWGLNNSTVFRQAEAFAGRAVKEGGKNPGEWVERAWLLALARAPTTEEKAEGLELLETLTARAEHTDLLKVESLAELPPQQASALITLCLGIYNLSEFTFVD